MSGVAVQRYVSMICGKWTRCIAPLQVIDMFIERNFWATWALNPGSVLNVKT